MCALSGDWHELDEQMFFVFRVTCCKMDYKSRDIVFVFLSEANCSGVSMKFTISKCKI